MPKINADENPHLVSLRKSSMDLLKEWRMHQPVVKLDKYSGNEYIEVPCKLVYVDKTQISGGWAKGLHQAEIEFLDFYEGTLKDGIAYMYHKTFIRMIDLGISTPNLTYVKITAQDNGVVFNIYKTSAYLEGILPILESKYLKKYKDYGWTKDVITSDGIFEFKANYNDASLWYHKHTFQPEEEYIPDDSNMDSSGWDFYNDQLDMDQQGPDFWDNIL